LKLLGKQRPQPTRQAAKTFASKRLCYDSFHDFKECRLMPHVTYELRLIFAGKFMNKASSVYTYHSAYTKKDDEGFGSFDGDLDNVEPFCAFKMIVPSMSTTFA
jgi:hypothetical protein